MRGRAGAPPRLRVGADQVDDLVRRVWLRPGHAGWPVVVSRGPLPPTHREVERYVVAPVRGRPRFLLPTGSGGAVPAAFTAHLTPATVSRRLAGAALTAAWRTGMTRRLAPAELSVGVERGVTDDDLPGRLLLSHLARLLDTPDVAAVWPVRAAMPHAKPTARLMSSAGDAVGYLKVGWSPGTRALVDNEARVLRRLGGGPSPVTTPRVLAHGEWEGRRYLVTSPLPRMRPLRTRPERLAAALLAIAATGDVRDRRLADSPWADSVRQRLARAAEAEPVVTELLDRWLQRVCRHSETVRFGAWHGDWVPWNLGYATTGPAAWDWESSADAVPLGFDLLHWHFQRALATSTLAGAVRVCERAAPGLAALGVPTPDRAAIVEAYLVEYLTRATELAGAGGGWNTRFHAELEQVLGDRAGSAAG